MNAPAAIGHNQPPDPCVGFSLHLDDLEEQAKAWLDGSGIQTEAQAEDVARLLDMVRKASNDADEARKAEKRPHDEAAKAVQARWKPILDKADLIAKTAKNALAPYLIKRDEEQRAAALAEQEEARRLSEAAAQTAASANADSLADQSAVEQARNAAHEAAQRAARLDKAKAQAKGGERAVGLRPSYRAEITDATAFARWVWANRRGEMLTFLELVADRECRGGDKHIPGLIVHTERKAA
jgi:hypothetical protein